MNFASLQHSVFLQALGSAILNSLWQGFILWLIYETVAVSYKNASSKFKNNFSTILLFFSFIWFVINFVSRFITKESIVANNQSFVGIGGNSLIHSVSGFERFITYAISSLPYLSVAYIFLLFFLMIKLLTAYRYVYIISNKRLANAPFELQFFAANVAQQMGIAKKIGVWISQHIDVPATIGFIKPVILIPVASINNLSGHQLEAIILHELSHIKRNDYLINLIISVIETILFFNPFVTLLSKVIKRERENCCDDFVLQYQYDPHAYASALLRLEQSRVNNVKLAMGAVSGKKQLLSRIKRITNNQSVSRQFNYGQKLLALVLVTGIICSVAWLSPQQKKSIENTIVKKQVDSSLNNLKIKSTYKVNNSTFNRDENLHAKILKRIIIKNNPTFLQNLNPPTDFSSQKIFDIKDKNENNTDLLPEESNEEIAENNNVKQPFFSFNEDDIQLPQSINIKNFPFQKMDFNIDLSKIDMKELNENLKKAYKEINALDWNKIQNEINQSFSQLNTVNIPSEVTAQTEFQKAQAIYQLKEAQRQYKKKFLTDNIKSKIALLGDSLLTDEIFTTDKKTAQVQEKLKQIQQQYAETLKSNFSYDYNYNEVGKNEKPEHLNQSLSRNNKELKNIKIVLKHLPSQINSVLNNKKLLQFSFNNPSKESGDQSIINIVLDTK